MAKALSSFIFFHNPNKMFTLLFPSVSSEINRRNIGLSFYYLEVYIDSNSCPPYGEFSTNSLSWQWCNTHEIVIILMQMEKLCGDTLYYSMKFDRCKLIHVQIVYTFLRKYFTISIRQVRCTKGGKYRTFNTSFRGFIAVVAISYLPKKGKVSNRIKTSDTTKIN